jgi:DNA ligase-1
MEYNSDLSELSEFIRKMNSSNSTNHKVEILREYSNSNSIKRFLEYTYTPYKQYGITSANLKKRQDLIAPESIYCDLFSMLDDLNERNLTGHSAISAANRFIADNLEYADLIYQIIDRNLETRATTTLINRVVPNLIPEFNVALAYDYTKVKGINLLDGTWYASRKLDGVRCIIIIRGGKISILSRNGKAFNTLEKIRREVEALGLNDCVLDGEICIMREDGSDDFQGIIKEIQRKNHTIQNPRFWVFDILTLSEFDSGVGKVPLAERLSRLSFTSDHILTLPQYLILSDNFFTQLKEVAKSEGWEGLMVRKNTGYEGSRTKNLLKLKEFYDAEYIVKEVIMEKQRVIVEGREVEEEVLSAVIIEHKGDPVRVGSGFSMDERREYYANPEKILGATITVQYFEHTVDQNGKNSLRFPVFKINHGKSRSI